MEPALPLDDVEFDIAAIEAGDFSNLSAEQYLSWVRHQASSLPNVSRAIAPVLKANSASEDANTGVHPSRSAIPQHHLLPQTEEILPCPPAFLPSEEWETDALHDFSELRQKLSDMSQIEGARDRRQAVPQLKDEEGWLMFCLGQSQVGNPNLEGDAAVDSDTPSIAGPLRAGLCEDVAPSGSGSLKIDLELRVRKRKRSLAKRLGIDLGVSEFGDGSDETDEVSTMEDGEMSDGKVCDDLQDAEDAVGGETGVDIGMGKGGDEAAVDSSSGAFPRSPWGGLQRALPTTSLLMQFDQVLTQRLLTFQVGWLEEGLGLGSLSVAVNREPTDSTNAENSAHEKDVSIAAARLHAQWLYSLLARLEKPVYQDTAAVLRQLYRRCCALRHDYTPISLTDSSVDKMEIKQSNDKEQENEEEDPLLASLNTLITITGSYFGQGEEFALFNYRLHQRLKAEEEQRLRAIHGEHDENNGLDDENAIDVNVSRENLLDLLRGDTGCDPAATEDGWSEAEPYDDIAMNVAEHGDASKITESIGAVVVEEDIIEDNGIDYRDSHGERAQKMQRTSVSRREGLLRGEVDSVLVLDAQGNLLVLKDKAEAAEALKRSNEVYDQQQHRRQKGQGVGTGEVEAEIEVGEVGGAAGDGGDGADDCSL